MRRLRNLLDGMPDEARCRRQDPDGPLWGATEELLAQIVEEVSVVASNKRRREPRTLPRPDSPGAQSRAQQPTATHGGLLTAAMKMGRVRRG